jgi:ssDNA-binding Zn-finger/Zn-ribbon topoisomerase 1
MSCQNRINKEIRCDYKCDIGENGEPKEKEIINKEIKYSDILCPSCGEPFIIRVGKNGKEYLGCRNFRDKKCAGFYNIEGNKIEFKKKSFKKWGKKKNK